MRALERVGKWVAVGIVAGQPGLAAFEPTALLLATSSIAEALVQSGFYAGALAADHRTDEAVAMCAVNVSATRRGPVRKVEGGRGVGAPRSRGSGGG